MNKKNFVKAKIHAQMTSAEMLKTIRELQGLSQLDLAKLTGMSQSNISALETGSKNIGRGQALVLAKAIKVHPAVILFPDFDIEQVA
ncbi:MAG: helix-turn-helix transcriptional regulator [Bacteriovoracaceae bacterium]|nr:helix-turn-helix transcriptional regulator [Bacteriovoracaceae bacterium]